MNSNSKFHLEDQLSTASTSPMNETELDFEPVVGDLSDITTTSAVVPITTKQLMTQTGEDVYDVITASPSGSSDGSSNEFVKVEHSDVQQNVELTGNPLSFKMLQMHDDADNEKRGTDRKYPVGNIMDREFVSEEPYSGILPRAEEFAEFAAEKVSDITKAGAGKVMDATNKAVNDAKVAGESLDDTIHLFGDKLKETARQAGDMGHQAVEAAKDTTSNMLSGIDMSEKTRSIGADVAHSLDEGANKAMDTFKEEFDDVSHGILDTAHLATSTLKNTLQEAGDVLKDAAPQLVHSAEDSLSDLNNKIKNSDLYARIETSGAIKPRQEDLIGLTDEINSASERDAGYRSIFQQSTGGTHQDVDYPSEKWNLDWRQYANEETGIGAHHSDFDVKAVHSAENAIHDEIVDVHDQVDSMIAKMSVAGAPQHDDSSAEESMFDRKGPLTIPQQTPDDMIQFEHGFDSSKQSGFEVSPRPPTPPKELDDEDVKPTTIDLGQTAGRLLVTGEHRSSILKNSTQGARFNFKDMDARFLDIIYWRDPKKSGAVLGVTLIALLVFANFPLIAVFSYVGLSILGGTLGFRIYKLIEAQIKKTDSTNPYQAYLEDKEFYLPKEKVHQQVDALIEHVQFIGNKLRRLFLVENIVESVKFGLLLWALTYVSCWFSGFSLLILAILAVFTIPKVYEVYQEPIDHNVSLAKQHVDNVNKMIGEKVPFLKKAAACDISHEKSY